jgi:hypothetical protein
LEGNRGLCPRGEVRWQAVRRGGSPSGHVSSAG